VRHSPAEQPLTESCFQKHHLEFARDKQQLVFPNGSRIAVPEPVFVNEGTAPAGATWSRLPLPGVGYGHRCACKIVMLFSICLLPVSLTLKVSLLQAT